MRPERHLNNASRKRSAVLCRNHVPV